MRKITKEDYKKRMATTNQSLKRTKKGFWLMGVR